MSKQKLIIYGYDEFHHEKYHCSVDYFIDNYKDFAKDDLTFRIFHSKEERDSFAFNKCLWDIRADKGYFKNDGERDKATKEAKSYLDNLKEINLDVAVSS